MIAFYVNKFFGGVRIFIDSSARKFHIHAIHRWLYTEHSVYYSCPDRVPYRAVHVQVTIFYKCQLPNQRIARPLVVLLPSKCFRTPMMLRQHGTARWWRQRQSGAMVLVLVFGGKYFGGLWENIVKLRWNANEAVKIVCTWWGWPTMMLIWNVWHICKPHCFSAGGFDEIYTLAFDPCSRCSMLWIATCTRHTHTYTHVRVRLLGKSVPVYSC